MPQNLEIKTRIADLAAARAAVVALGARYVATEEQVDRYYEIDGGRRVKLRTIDGQAAHLIHYHRPETGAVRTSDYELTPVRDAAAGACLVPQGEPLVVVRKRREIHLHENVRIHLDQVDGLGTFLELEAMVDATHDAAGCQAAIATITRALALSEADFLRASYADLQRRGGTA